MAYLQQRKAGTSVQAKRSANVVDQLKTYLAQDNVKARFNEILGKNAPQYMASIANVVAGNKALQNCSATSIMSAAFVAATYNLPIDSNLGFAAIVPYNHRAKVGSEWVDVSEAQFQMMYKGFVQLAIRSGQYLDMNCSAVYADEIKSYNPITGECSFVEDFNACTDRRNGKDDKIVGYYAWFRLNTGFRKGIYMTVDEIRAHGAKYSMSYKADLRKGEAKSLWSTNFDAMAKKTMIKTLLSKWGILSIQTMSIQSAITNDQKVYDDAGNGDYLDNKPDEEGFIDTTDAADATPENPKPAELPGMNPPEPETAANASQPKEQPAATEKADARPDAAPQGGSYDGFEYNPNGQEELPFK